MDCRHGARIGQCNGQAVRWCTPAVLSVPSRASIVEQHSEAPPRSALRAPGSACAPPMFHLFGASSRSFDQVCDALTDLRFDGVIEQRYVDDLNRKRKRQDCRTLITAHLGFQDYFRKNYIGRKEGARYVRPRFAIAAWNCFTRTIMNTARTNNGIEGVVLLNPSFRTRSFRMAQCAEPTFPSVAPSAQPGTGSPAERGGAYKEPRGSVRLQYKLPNHRMHYEFLAIMLALLNPSVGARLPPVSVRGTFENLFSHTTSSMRGLTSASNT